MENGSQPRPHGDSVDLKDEGQVEIWTRSLGITRELLEQAVAAVGSSTGEVYDYIGRSRLNRPPA
jgi:hypothetical protein